MGKLDPERKKVVVLCAAVAAMSGGGVLLEGHPKLLAVWIGLMAVMLVYAVVEFVKWTRRAR